MNVTCDRCRVRYDDARCYTFCPHYEFLTAEMLSAEEEEMLRSFRRYKLRMTKDGEVFKWQTRRPEGIQIAEDTANIVHPSEVISE